MSHAQHQSTTDHFDRFENADAARDYVAQRDQREREDTVETLQHLSTWERLQREREKRARTVHIWGEPVELYPAGTDPITDVLEFTQSLSDDQVETIEQATDGEDAAIEELREAVDAGGAETEMFRAVCDIMAEYAVDDSMTRKRWGQIPPEVVMQAFEQWADDGLGADEREEIDSFPDE